MKLDIEETKYVLNCLAAVAKVIKKRFNNINVTEAMSIASDIMLEVTKVDVAEK